MARKHSTANPAGHFTLTLNEDGTWRTETIIAALLADVRRLLEEQNRKLSESNIQQRLIYAQLRQLNRRLLANGFKVRGSK